MFFFKKVAKDSFPVPILFNVFNRPDQTKRVFGVIRKVRPKYLFLKADGPRESIQGDRERCRQVRDIISRVDWDCEVQTLFFDQNLGCRDAMSRGIDWFFSKVDEGIILEDDCLPDFSFFNFCQQLLERYRHDERVMMISGDSFLFGRKKFEASYHFSKYALIWGWATWSRAWSHYDVEMATFPQFRDERLISNIIDHPKEQDLWMYHLQKVFDNEINTWDYQWTYALFNRRGLSVTPNVNLITNIGFNRDATHTLNKRDRLANLKRGRIEQIVHPVEVSLDEDADRLTIDNIYHFG
ncbi:MAG: hypothetical protein EBU88_10600 [Acidobacteria bacterium]|nr:hypothetical protein [Acidobacteriota bacterium]